MCHWRWGDQDFFFCSCNSERGQVFAKLDVRNEMIELFSFMLPPCHPTPAARESETGEVRGKRIGQGLKLGRDRIADGLEAVVLLGNAQKSVC